MKLTLLCNAGLALEEHGQVLLVDLPNEKVEPFYRLPDLTWEKILNRKPPYDTVVGIYFTHIHPDHCDLNRLQIYRDKWPDTPVFVPNEHPSKGSIQMGLFQMDYERMDHAPIPDPPPHVVTIVRGGQKKLYLAGDSNLCTDAHRRFLKGETMDCAVWNAMFLSRAETRKLMSDTALRNLIVHMPEQRPDACGIWKKLEHNLIRFPEELRTVEVLAQYPTEVIL